MKQENKNLTDQRFFLGRWFQDYLFGMAKGFCRKGPESLTVVWNRDRMDAGGCTDGKNIRINAAAAARSGSREQKVLGIVGVAAHECGHINFSNFEKRRIYASGIREGILYPELPEPKNEQERQALGELQTCLNQKKEQELRVIRETLLYLHNILEDMYIEAKYSLQGTTQGRYLTGGVPPVRFSM